MGFLEGQHICEHVYVCVFISYMYLHMCINYIYIYMHVCALFENIFYSTGQHKGMVSHRNGGLIGT